MPDGAAPPAVAEAERWFQAHGLSYFVPDVRDAVRAGLRPRRFLPPLLGVALLAVGVGVLLAWLSDEVTAAPAVIVSFAGIGALGYALTALRAQGIVVWALNHTFGSLRVLVPMVSRALPLLLVFVTFLFINAEAWQMTANLKPGILWTVVLLLTALAVLFLLVRLPEEVDRVDDAVDEEFLRRTTRGTPLEADAVRLVEEGRDPAANAQVAGYDRWNLILVLLVVQIGQVLLLAVTVFCFFLLFGSLVMTVDVQNAWTGLDGGVDSFSFLPTLSYELLKVSLFLAAFSGLYFTVSAVTDDTYRSQFFAAVTEELERAVGMRAVYLTLRVDDAAHRS
ncbi:hypothetical protein FE634_14250 [Nocardioides dongxiaopingii]|uniref:hypothetical protein n=1 Tax=Nocardioides sp. S-1144 TaxID=2582905 RepID=UPI00116544D5|nr:hypothetical protein [Nocardioides sp. S-1144]QDH11018.1 hypothetical protein FE634_14250 [Nocardioides sp. S-1144]